MHVTSSLSGGTTEVSKIVAPRLIAGGSQEMEITQPRAHNCTQPCPLHTYSLRTNRRQLGQTSERAAACCCCRQHRLSQNQRTYLSRRNTEPERGSRNIATTGVVKLNTSQYPRLHHVLPSPLCCALPRVTHSRCAGSRSTRSSLAFLASGGRVGLGNKIWMAAELRTEREGERTPPRTTDVPPSSPPPCRI